MLYRGGLLVQWNLYIVVTLETRPVDCQQKWPANTWYCDNERVLYIDNAMVTYAPYRDPSVLSDCKFDGEEEEEVLMSNIKHRLTPHPVKIRAGTGLLERGRGDQILRVQIILPINKHLIYRY